MIISATVCPSRSDWSRWLAGQTNEEDQFQYDNHARSCPSCQSTVNDLTDEPALRAWTTPFGLQTPRYPYFDKSRKAGSLGRLGEFEIEEELAHGGMGVVFRATDTALNRSVAIKVLRVGREDERFVERFHREARAAAKIRHDHVLPILAIERTHDGRPLLVMPLVIGSTLKDRIVWDQALPPIEVVEIIRGIADGLQTAHEAGLLHRDVKPSNILLDRVDGRAKLADFGLVRNVEDESLTADGVVGTPEYMSVEQMSGSRNLDARSDVYSLGATMYEALTGRPPIRGSLLEILKRANNEEIISPSQLMPGIPVDLETIVLKALARDPQHRYATAAAFRDDLVRWQRHEPIHARPATRFEQLRKWSRRHPAVTVAMAMGLLLIVALSSATIWLRSSLIRTREAERQAEVKRIEAENSLSLQKAVSDFFGGYVLGVNGVGRKGRRSNPDLRVSDLLETASTEINQYATTPVAKSEIHLQIGMCFFILGLPAKAMMHFEMSEEFAETLDPADDFRKLERRRMLATTRCGIGQTQKGIPELEKVLSECWSQLGDTHNLTLLTEHDLATFYANAGRWKEAIPLHEHVVSNRTQELGKSSEITISCCSALGVAYSGIGRYAEAESLLSNTLAEAELALGSDHLTTSLVLSNLASALDHQKKFTQAIPLHERSLANVIRILGTTNERTLIIRNNLALDFSRTGQYSKALVLLRQVVADTEMLNGKDHPSTIIPRGNLATFEDQHGDSSNARQLLEMNCRLAEQVYGQKDTRTITQYHNFANQLRYRGRFDEAAKMWETHVIPQARETYGRDHPNTFVFTRNWIRTLESMERFEVARSERAKLIDLVRHKHGKSLQLAIDLDEFGQSLLEQKMPAIARPLLEESLALQQIYRQPPKWEMERTKLWLAIAKAHNAEIKESLQAIESQNSTIPGDWKQRMTREGLLALYSIASNEHDEAEMTRICELLSSIETK